MINFGGDEAIAHVKEVTWHRVFTGRVNDNPPTDYESEFPDANPYYQGLIFPGNYLSSGNIPNLDMYYARYAEAEVVRSTIVVKCVNASPARPKDVGVMLMCPNKEPSSLPYWGGTDPPTEQPRCSYRTLTPAGGSRSMAKVVGSTTNKIAFGNNKASTSALTTLNASALYSRPQQFYYWYVFQGQSYDNTPDPTPSITQDFEGVYMVVKQYWTIRFFSRIQEVA